MSGPSERADEIQVDGTAPVCILGRGRNGPEKPDAGPSVSGRDGFGSATKITRLAFEMGNLK